MMFPSDGDDMSKRPNPLAWMDEPAKAASTLEEEMNASKALITKMASSTDAPNPALRDKLLGKSAAPTQVVEGMSDALRIMRKMRKEGK